MNRNKGVPHTLSTDAVNVPLWQVLELFTSYTRSSSNYYTIRTDCLYPHQYHSAPSATLSSRPSSDTLFGSLGEFSNSLSGMDILNNVPLAPASVSSHARVLTIVGGDTQYTEPDPQGKHFEGAMLHLYL